MNKKGCNKEEKLSIIIPNYNNACYLEQCVRSVLRQTFPVYEVVIVDDGSTDDSRQVLEQLLTEDKRIKTVFKEKNSGVSETRNIGFAHSTGDYITFIDADDYYDNERKIENEMRLIGKWKQHGKDIVAYSQTVHIDAGGNLLKKGKQSGIFFSQGAVYTDFISGFRFNRIPRDYCISREAFAAAGGYSYPVDFYEDLDLLIRIALKYKFYYTGEVGTAHRLTGIGLSSRTREEHLSAREKIRGSYYIRLSPGEKAIVALKQKIIRFKEYVKKV